MRAWSLQVSWLVPNMSLAFAAGVYAFTVIGIYRFCYGILTITTLLLYRNYLPDDGFFRNGLAGLRRSFSASQSGLRWPQS